MKNNPLHLLKWIGRIAYLILVFIVMICIASLLLSTTLPQAIKICYLFATFILLVAEIILLILNANLLDGNPKDARALSALYIWLPIAWFFAIIIASIVLFFFYGKIEWPVLRIKI